jgi:hypothetical protein
MARVLCRVADLVPRSELVEMAVAVAEAAEIMEPVALEIQVKGVTEEMALKYTKVLAVVL